MKKIRLVHILTETDTPREQASISSLSPLTNYGIEYVQQVNQRYRGDDWRLAPAISQSQFTNHGPGHYGAFQSFKKAIIENFDEDLDALVLCECDCVLEVSHQHFIEKLNRGIDFSNKHELRYLSLGSRFVNDFLQSPEQELDPEYGDFYVTTKIILAHCVVLPNLGREFYLDALQKFSWDSPDIWFNEVNWLCDNYRFGIIRERLAFQHEGHSLIDDCWKESQ
jgi:hypothetical protein